MSGGMALINTALATRFDSVAADVAGDFATAGGMANVHGVFEVERFREGGQIVGVGVHVVAVRRSALERPWPRRSWAMQR